MSSTGRRRIAKIEGSLTPRQSVLLWLEEASEFGSLRDYVLSIKDQPDAVFPLVRLPDQVEHSVRSAMKGYARSIVESAVRSAVRDVAFLFCLLMQINSRELADRRGNCLHLMLVIERLRSFLGDEPLVGPRYEQWLEFVETLASRLLTLTGAADLIGARYFGGRSPLLPDSADDLSALVAPLEGMIELYNDRLEDEELWSKRGRVSKAPAPIDLEGLRARASDGAMALVQELVTMAKTEALLMMGERNQGVLPDG